MEAVVLLVYLATFSAGSGMSGFSQEFATIEACSSAGAVTVKRFSGFYTRVFWSCVGKVSGQEKSHGQS